MSAINAAQNNIGTADNCHRVTQFVAAQEFRHNLQIDKGRSAHLHPPWIFAAIADQIVAILSAAVFDSEVGLPPWRSQGYRHTGSNGTRRQFVDSDTAQANALVNFLHAHFIAGEAIPFLAYLHIDRHFSVCHIRARHTYIKVDSAPTQHGTAESICNGLGSIDEAYTLRASLKDLIARDQPF